jgi:hypothetical protein
MRVLEVVVNFLEQYFEFAPDPTPTCTVPEPIECPNPYMITFVSTIFGFTLWSFINNLLSYKSPMQNASTYTDYSTTRLQPEDIDSIVSSEIQEEFSQEFMNGDDCKFTECDLH